MRTRRLRRRRSRRRLRGGSALIGKPYGPTTWGTSNYYAYNSTPKLEYPAHHSYQSQKGGGNWADMFDPRARPIQPAWSIKDSVGYGLHSGFNAFMGRYPTVNPNHLVGHFQK